MGRAVVAALGLAVLVAQATSARAQEAGTTLAPPVAAAPQTPAGYAAAPGPPRLLLTANAPGVTFHVLDASGGGAPLCTAPCAALLPPGMYRLALSRGNGDVHVAPELVAVQGNTHVVGLYHSHNGARIAGGVVLGVGAANVLTFLLLGALYNDPYGSSSTAAVYFAVGGVVGVVALIVGLILLAMGDSANVIAAPGP